jgi:hypothetical protein
MRLYSLLPTVLAASAVASGNAQNPPVIGGDRAGKVLMPSLRTFGFNEEPRAVIGITTSGASTSRDTLGKSGRKGWT